MRITIDSGYLLTMLNLARKVIRNCKRVLQSSTKQHFFENCDLKYDKKQKKRELRLLINQSDVMSFMTSINLYLKKSDVKEKFLATFFNQKQKMCVFLMFSGCKLFIIF